MGRDLPTLKLQPDPCPSNSAAPKSKSCGAYETNRVYESHSSYDSHMWIADSRIFAVLLLLESHNDLRAQG